MDKSDSMVTIGILKDIRKQLETVIRNTKDLDKTFIKKQKRSKNIIDAEAEDIG